LRLATVALLFAGCGGSNAGTAPGECEAESTFAQIQEQIFEARGCTLSSCHGDSPQSGLDLRPDVAYQNLVNVDGVAGDFKRVFPAEQDLSLLYLKVAAKGGGESLSKQGISGGAMPVGEDALDENDLGLLRTWIRGGAPEEGIVEGSQQFASCALEGEIAPNKIEPLPPPAAGEGIQFYGGGWTVPAEGEGEVCYVTYYDYSDEVPDRFKVPCGDAQGGPELDCFAYNQILLVQAPQSHHSIVEFYVPPVGKEDQWDPMGGAWDNWSCLGGDRAGASCVPGSDECGSRGQCTTRPETSVGCVAYRNAPPELGSLSGFVGQADTRLNLATAQEATFRERYPTDVFSLMPVKGFVIWNNHAFNTTTSDASVEQWMNVAFAALDEQVYPRVQIFDASEIFGMGTIDAFSSKEVCNTYTIPRHARLLTLSSHTHKRGKRFRIWYPPNDPCSPGPGCTPPAREHDYISRDYADPLYQRFSEPDLPTYDSDDARDRTFHYCSLWDNGDTNPSEVRRETTKPDAETCDFLAGVADLITSLGLTVLECGCDPAERSCFGGPSQGMPCNGDDSVCGDGGVCDACPAGGGITTEEEMFVLFGSYFVQEP
ncbi:MAG: hypothetical protein WBG86_10200, partial [Polyangiales bacterium]